MLSEEKIKKMIRLSDYESGQGETDLRRVRYLKMDYVRLQVLKTVASVFTAFLLILGIIAIYNVDYILQNALELPIKTIALYGGMGVAAVCLVSVIATCRIASEEYEESCIRVREYESTLRELMRIYEREDQGQGGLRFMMMMFLVLKSKIKNFYEKYYRVTRGVLKFIAMMSALLLITVQMDYNDFLGQYWLLALEALVCAVTPDGVAAMLFLLVVCGEISGVSVLLSVTVLVIILVYLLLYGRLEKKQYYLIFLIPVLGPLHISYVVPVVAALYASPVVIPALIMGILLQYMIQGVAMYSAAASGVAESENILSSLQYMIDYLMQNQMMFVMIIAFCMTFICVYMIRRRNFNHASHIAILVGVILLMAVELLSNIILELEINLVWLTVEVVISMLIAYIIQFFHITLDYHGTKKLQFEDDEYYYYVTAVPKFKVTVVDRTVTRILPEDAEDTFDLKEELEKALMEEEDSANPDKM